MQAVEWFVNLLTAYAASGVLFAIAFVAFGIGRVDAAAEHAPIGFRLLVIPGVAALWPLLLRRWLRAAGEGR
jgi:hypothetical protein